MPGLARLCPAHAELGLGVPVRALVCAADARAPPVRNRRLIGETGWKPVEGRRDSLAWGRWLMPGQAWRCPACVAPGSREVRREGAFDPCDARRWRLPSWGSAIRGRCRFAPPAGSRLDGAPARVLTRRVQQPNRLPAGFA